jgi:hypothetical protein
MTNRSTLYDEHPSCEMSVVSRNQDAEQCNVQNGHRAAANYHNRGNSLIIVAKTTWWKGLHSSCFVFGEGGGGCRVQILAQKFYPDGIRFASLAAGQHTSA